VSQKSSGLVADEAKLRQSKHPIRAQNIPYVCISDDASPYILSGLLNTSKPDLALSPVPQTDARSTGWRDFQIP
jgi:hypothetical protein